MCFEGQKIIKCILFKECYFFLTFDEIPGKETHKERKTSKVGRMWGRN